MGNNLNGTRGKSDRFGSGDGTNLTILPNFGMVRKLWEENWGEIDAKTYMSVLRKERNNDSTLDRIWKRSESWYRERRMPRREFSNKYRESFDDEAFLHAIITYTMEDSWGNVYDHFNNQCREFAMGKLSWASFRYKSLWFLLHFSVPQLPDYIPENVTLYRGQSGYIVDAEEAMNNETPVSINAAFSSFSTIRNEALKFIKGRPNPCLLVCEGRPNYAGYLVKYSWLPHEEEVLVCPQSAFIVTKITNVYYDEFEDGKREVRKIMLKPWSDQERR